MTHYAAIVTAYSSDRPLEFNAAVENYRQWLREKFVPELNKGRREFFYNSFGPFYKALVIYVLAFVLACASWFNLSDWLRRSALYLAMLAWCIHTFGLIFRMWLEGRPPVTNLYSSAIFIGWGGVFWASCWKSFIVMASAAPLPPPPDFSHSSLRTISHWAVTRWKCCGRYSTRTSGWPPT